MDLFILTNSRAFPSVHALMIQPFKDMWENDTTEDKVDAILKFSYIELVCSPKKSNPFHGYAEEIRPERVKKELYGDEEAFISQDVMLGCMKYKELLLDASPTMPMYSAGLTAAGKLKRYLETFDLTERTGSGGMVIKPADITKALKEIPDVAKGIIAMREKVNTELEEENKTRNQREIGDYER